tara:strand:- start:3682 stop:4110 length:429 start_codon:yes stop_codon:yes gene_type:complete
LSPNVEIRLHNYVESQIGIPFEFGVNDCPLFTLGAIDILLNTEHKKEFIGKWNDQKSAWKYAKKHGDIYEHLLKWDFKRVDIQFIQIGDIIIMAQDLAHAKKWRSVAVCMGSKIAIVSNENGVELVDIRQVPNVTGVVRHGS